MPFSKKSLLLVSHSQCWTRWPAFSSSVAATKRVDGADRLDERVAIVERDLHLEPLDAAGILLELPRFDRLELIARHRRPAREVGRQQILRVRDELVAVPESDRVAEPGVRAVDVLVLLADVDAADSRAEIVDQVRLLRQIDELVRVRLEQPARIADRLAVGETIVLDLAQLRLLAPALLVRRSRMAASARLREPCR